MLEQERAKYKTLKNETLKTLEQQLEEEMARREEAEE